MKTRLILTLFFGLLLTVIACEPKTSPEEPEAEVPAIDEAAYLEKGKAIASATFATLSGKLQKAMQDGGVANAVQYCNLAAYPLVDSLSEVHQADIRRTSLQVRNPKNKPTPQEQAQLEAYQQTKSKGEALKPTVKILDDQTVAFYAPISVNAFCLKCHGKAGETMTEADAKIINELYPSDQATGYVDGDLRGMWSINFKQ